MSWRLGENCPCTLIINRNKLINDLLEMPSLSQKDFKQGLELREVLWQEDNRYLKKGDIKMNMAEERKSWRPEGWKNPYAKHPKVKYTNSDFETELDLVISREHKAYEDSADAMLDSLRKQNLRIPETILATCGKPHADWYTVSIPTLQHIAELGQKRQGNIKGIWVFIPDDDKD